MKDTFWLLDLNQQIYNGKSSIWMWGINREGKRILIIDTHFQPYFYLDPKFPATEVETIKTRILREKPHPSIESVTIEIKKILDVHKPILKIQCNDPFSVEKAARQTLQKIVPGNIFEADLRQATKYQNEYHILPCKWYRVQIDDELANPSKYSVDIVGLTRTEPTIITNLEEIPSLRYFAFEILTASQYGVPMPRRDPIYAIAWRTNSGKSGILQQNHEGDAVILEQFIEVLTSENPDVIFTFDGNSSQWPYLEKRAEENGIDIRIGRQQGVPHQSLYGHYSITGRANVDLADFTRFLYEIKNRTLQNLAAYFSISTGTVERIRETEYFKTLTDTDQRQVLLDQVMSDTKVVLGVADDAFTYVTQVSSLSGLPPDQAIAAGVGFRVDNYLMMEAHALGQVIPTRYEQYAVPYKGALVIEPKMGLYENVALLDFSSMYPRLMVKYNISPDTLIPIHGDQRLGKIYQVPEVHHSFRASPPGFYTVALTKLLEIRKTTKFELKETSVNDPKYKLLRARDTATKITTNAVYGYAGWAGARWYSREVAESAAALGRDTIQHSIAIAEQLNLEVLYSDTDSLFVKYDEKLIAKFLKEIDSKFKLEISISQIYKRILFTEAKKKYAGLRRDGEIDIVGLEAIRGDWSLLAKNVQNDIVRIILEHKEPKDAVEYVSKLIRKLDRGDDDIPLSSFIIWKSLTRPVAKYEVNAPHVEAAKRMLKDGSPVSVGDKIGFIITNRGGRLYQKAEPYYKVKREQIDVNYYVRNQIIPAAARITEIFGYTEEKLIEIAESSQQENVLSKH